jgi:hypothetical protein
MKLRLVAGVLLLLVAVGLPLAAMSGSGPPWGFRGHSAVVIEVTGTVEGTASEQRRQRENALDDKLDVAPNLHMDPGDELRVARLSQAHIRFAGVDVRIGDGARVLVEDAGVRLVRGLVDVNLSEGGRTFTVELDSGGAVVVRGASAHARVLADGKGGVVAFVTDGSLAGRSTRGEVLVEPGRMLSLRGDVAKVVDRPDGVSVAGTCANGKLNIVASANAQVFVAGGLAYPDVSTDADTGSVVVDVEPTAKTVSVLARDIFGTVKTVVVACDTGKKR